jgi:hypothetical protein
MKIIKPKWGNCLLWAIYFLFKFKIEKIIFLKGIKDNIPHIICETRSGHIIQFKTTKKYDKLAPVFFEGRIRGTRKKYVKRAFSHRVIFEIPFFYYYKGW